MKDIICHRCGECCNYIVITIPKPKTTEDFELIKWYLLHNNVYVYIDKEDAWCVEFITVCNAKDKVTKLCSLYEKRPKICRDYDEVKKRNCSYYGNNIYKKRFFTIDDIDKYIKQEGINDIS
jgi:uncharacterized protein